MNALKPARKKISIRRSERTHKGDYGHGLLAAGSQGMMGAAFLSAGAALRAGIGKLTYAGPEAIIHQLMTVYPEVMSLPLVSKGSAGLGPGAAERVIRYGEVRKVNVAALGPGMGAGVGTRQLVLGLLKTWSEVLILDADALNALAGIRPETLRRSGAKLVLTPHDEEFKRVFGRHPGLTTKLRLRVAKEIANQYHCTIVLKGFESIVASFAGETHVNLTGTPALARGGTGDLLTGMILGLTAQGLDVFLGTACAVFLHGLTACSLENRTGMTSVLASDVLGHLPRVMGSIEREPDLRKVIVLDRRSAEKKFGPWQ